MRNLVLASVLLFSGALIVVACTAVPPITTARDLSSPFTNDDFASPFTSSDLKNQVPHDGSPGGTMTGCHGYTACIAKCVLGPDPDADLMCKANMCDPFVSTQGYATFNTALMCGQNWCIGASGGMVCAWDSGHTMLGDSGTANDGDCNACLNNALAALLLESCTDTSDPNCNPASCKADNTACTNSLP